MKQSKTFTLTNELGLHARVAAMIVKVLDKYEAEVMLEKDGRKVNGRSILDILTLACPKGGSITIEVIGIDAHAVIAELEKLIENKFGEN